MAYNSPPANMPSSGGTMIQRPSGAAYSTMRGGPIPPQTGGKRPADTRGALQQKQYVSKNVSLFF